MHGVDDSDQPKESKVKQNGVGDVHRQYTHDHVPTLHAYVRACASRSEATISPAT